MSLGAPDPFSRHIEAVAKHFWKDPNPRLSNNRELRWGSQGSMCVDLDKGVFFDNEAGEGGGVLSLVEREMHLKGREAVDYLRETVGLDIPDDRPERTQFVPKKIEATYDYVDENGDFLFQVVRLIPKDFRQRRRDPAAADGWSWSVKGLRQVPYRLPDLIEAVSMGRRVCIVEGEKDVDRLYALDIPATCNAGGAGKWPTGLAEHLRGAEVVILPDNDDAGRNHLAIVGAALKGVAASVGVLELPDLPYKGDVSDWLDAGGDVESLTALLDHGTIPWMHGAPSSQFGAVTWLGISRIKPRTDYVVEDLLFPSDLMLTYGESRSGKSFLSIDLSMAIARGVPFFDMQTRQGAVIYQAGEGASGVVSRLQAYGVNYGLASTELPFVLMKSRIDLYAKDGDVEAFIDELKAWQAWLPLPLAMVTIDTFSAATPGANENASEDVSRIIANAKRIKEATGAAVNFVHHKNAGGVKARGHTSLFADADAALDVTWEDEEVNYRNFRLAKVKDGADGKRYGFKLQPVDIGSNDDGKILTSCVVIPAQEDDPQAGSKKTYLSSAKFKFMKLLDDALAQRGGILTGSELPHNMYGVDWHTFAEIYKAASMGHKDDAVRQALKRDGDALHNAGLIGRNSPWIWITDKGRAVLK